MAKKKSRRKTKGKSEKEEEDFDVGDEEAELKTKFGSIGEDDDDFYEDEVDKFHKDEDKILLDKAGGKLIDDDDSDAEGVKEVLKFDEDSDDDDDDDSDEEMSQMIKIQMNRLKRQGKGLELESEGEEEEEEEDEKKKPKDDKAGTWGGTKSSAYYGADHLESDESDDEETEDAQRLEYEEAMLIQKRIESKFDEDDFGLDLLQTTTPAAAAGDDRRPQPKDDATILADLSRLSKSEKLALLKKESPEFLGLVKDYRDKLIELRDRVQPLFDLVREGKIPSTSGGAADFVRLKYKTLAGYCVNLSFYLMLKAKKVSVVDHPVVKRLLQYKRTMLELEPLDEKLGGEIDRILKMVSEGKELRPKAASVAVEPEMADKVGMIDEEDESDDDEDDDDDDDDDGPVGSDADDDDDDDEVPDELPSNGGRGGKKRKKATSDAVQHSIRDDVEAKLKKMKKLKTSDLNDDETEAEDKRKATKEMEKNRGLTPHKRKDLKNPRVRLREKYRKAKIRRKGAVRDQRFEAGNYGGEASGIRAGLKKGIKIL